MERSEKDSGDKPVDEWKIADCGALSEDYVLNPADQDDGTGDIYEEVLHDNDIRNIDVNNPQSVFNAISRVKDIGTKLLKEGKLNKAYEKYAKAVGFATDYFPEELSENDVSELNKLKFLAA